MRQRVHPQRTMLRKPRLEDGPEIWRLVRDSDTLDLNSCYCYLLLCRHFSDTCVVADRDGVLAGFLSAYRPPSSPRVLFVWQIGVASHLRRQGLGTAMLEDVLQREPCRRVTVLETTVTRSNTSSRRLFLALARRLHAEVEERIVFPERLFPGEHHEAEHLIRIGPFDVSTFSEEGVNGGYHPES